MSFSQSDLLALAKQGDSKALSTVMSYLLESKGIIVAANLAQGCLHLVLQAEATPSQEQSIIYIHKILEQLKLDCFTRVKIYGRRQGATFHAWTQELNAQTALEKKSSFWNAIEQQTTKIGEALNSSTTQAGQTVAQKMAGFEKTVSSSALQASQAVAKTATEWGDAANHPLASQVSRAVTEAALKTGETVSTTASQVNRSIAETTSGGQSTVNEPLDLAKVPENERLAFYGALFAIATADGQLDKAEMELVFGIMDLENMSEEAKRQVQSFVINPPSLWDCLRTLSNVDERLRFGLMVNLVDTAWANDELDPNEEKAIILAQKELNITNEQSEAIKKFIQKIREIRVRGLNDDQAADAVKAAAAGLGAVGIPIAAVYFSGSVIGLSAAGITSGLAALGLGFGMVPGIGIAVLVGAGIFMTASNLLDLGGNRKKEEHKKMQERKAQLVIKNMQETMSRLIAEITKIQEKAVSLEANAATAEANREAVRVLTERLKFMQQAVTKRKQFYGEA